MDHIEQDQRSFQDRRPPRFKKAKRNVGGKEERERSLCMTMLPPKKRRGNVLLLLLPMTQFAWMDKISSFLWSPPPSLPSSYFLKKRKGGGETQMKERREVQKARWEFKVPPFTHYVPNQALTLLALNHSLRLEGKWDVGRRSAKGRGETDCPIA